MSEAALRTSLPLIASVALLLNPMLLSYALSEDKLYTLSADGYIQGSAKITCWEYDDGPKIHIRVDVTKAFHMKGAKLMSAYIVDITKNGANSYIEIGSAVHPLDEYDYIAFAGFFDSKDFPSTVDNDSCPIGDVGRIVVVVGTSPPTDDDTLDEGAVDIIASSISGVAQTGLL